MSTTARILRNFVAGDWRESTGEMVRAIDSPVTGEKLADVPDASADDVERATRAAREAQLGWAALSAWERARVCHRIADLIDERKEWIARVLALERGEPYGTEEVNAMEERAVRFTVPAED